MNIGAFFGGIWKALATAGKTAGNGIAHIAVSVVNNDIVPLAKAVGHMAVGAAVGGAFPAIQQAIMGGDLHPVSLANIGIGTFIGALFTALAQSPNQAAKQVGAALLNEQNPITAHVQTVVDQAIMKAATLAASPVAIPIQRNPTPAASPVPTTPTAAPNSVAQGKK